MNRILVCSLVGVMGLSAIAAAQQAPSPPPSRVIRGMRYPAVSPDGSRIVFSYRGDLWTVAAAGGEAKRLADHPGWDVRARWSPDGQTIAFSSDTTGNMDLYTIPAGGGPVKQVTFHTSDDVLSDWSPDGKSLLFYSARDSRVPILYSLRLEDGRLRELMRDDETLQSHTLSPDGKLLAYVRGRADWARKGYRGSSNADLWVVPTDKPGAAPRQLTHFDGNDMWPMFNPSGQSIYYTCDADGVGNIWKIASSGGRPAQVTHQRDGYVHYPCLSRTGHTLVYETDFSLWTVDPTARRAEPHRLTVTAAVEDKPRIETRDTTARVEELEVSPDGTQLAVGIRGDIFLVPSAGGDARRVTDSLARDYDFEWSPDGKSLAYVSEREANQDIYLLDVASGVSRRMTTDPEPESSPQFSPDGRYLSFVRGSSGGEVVVLPLAGGPERVAVHGPYINNARWSPDSRWLAYSRRSLADVTNVYVSPVAGGPEINVSRWDGSNLDPVWSPDGTRLFFFSGRSGSLDIYAADLTRPHPTPQATNSGTSAPGAPAATAGDHATAASAGTAVATPSVSIEPEGIWERVRPLPGAPAGTKMSLTFTADRKSCLFTVAAPTSGGGTGPGGPGRRGGFGRGGGLSAVTLYSMPLAGGEPKKVADGLAGAVRPSPDATTLYTFGFGGIRKVALPAGTATDVAVKASFSVDLAEERRQVFDQAWRLMRDHFYDAKLHGANWDQVRARYRPIVDECVDIKDFHLLLTEMVGELNASHTGVSEQAFGRGRGPGGPGGGGFGGGGPRDETASLGLWFDWNREGPGLKVTDVLRQGPADVDESRVKSGEYVLAVAGHDAAPTEGFLHDLAGMAGKSVEVLVNSVPDKTGARTVKLTPISRSRFSELLYEQWVHHNREEVDRLSHGKLAYLHIRAMDQPSLQRFTRELVTEAYDRKGLVLDVRNNGGGRIHDELLGLLTHSVHAFETPRGGLKMTQPFGAFTHPMILLINGSSFSDAEIFPNGFRADHLGKIVGVPTGGAVIGTADQVLLDGRTRFRVPQTRWDTLDGRNMEHWGVPPDIYVDITPADFEAGRDPQLERAVSELDKELGTGK